MEYYSAIKKIFPFATTWMGLEVITQSQIKTNTNMKSKKKANEQTKQNRNRLTENKLVVTKGGEWLGKIGEGY